MCQFLPLHSSAAACERASGRRCHCLWQTHRPLLPTTTQRCHQRTPETMELVDRHMAAAPRWMHGWRPCPDEKHNEFQVELDRMLAQLNQSGVDVTGESGEMEIVDWTTVGGPCSTVQMSTLCKQRHIRAARSAHLARSLQSWINVIMGTMWVCSFALTFVRTCPDVWLHCVVPPLSLIHI